MKAKNVTEAEMEKALEIVNKRFKGNVIWNRFEPLGKRFNFTLKVKDSKEPGHRRGFQGQRMVSACWHVHGYFFEALLEVNENAVISSCKSIIDKNGGNWQDSNIGSMMNPLYFSDACDCEG